MTVVQLVAAAGFRNEGCTSVISIRQSNVRMKENDREKKSIKARCEMCRDNKYMHAFGRKAFWFNMNTDMAAPAGIVCPLRFRSGE